jgi:hypothetical protein
MHLKYVLALFQCLAWTACSAHVAHQAQPPPLRATIREETPLSNPFLVQPGQGIAIEATMSKSNPAVTDGIVVRSSTGFYQIVWQGAGNFVVYAGSSRTSKLIVVAASAFMKSDVLPHEFTVSVAPVNRANHIVASVDNRRLIDTTDKAVLIAGKRVSAAVVGDGYLMQGLVEHE